MLDLHWPVLQVSIPLLGSLLIALISSVICARFLALLSALMSFSINFFGLMKLNGSLSYNISNWRAPIGIEYKIDLLNQPVIMYTSGVLIFTLLCCHRSIIDDLESNITSSRSHLLYTMILLVHTGLSGMLSTNDIFNFYVFLEIASLASYALISQGSDKNAPVGALDYLILGTVGASLILIGIGILFSSCGTLNISDLHFRLVSLYRSRMVILGIGFFITGCMLKIALFPLHIWMIKAYKSASPSVLVYLAGVSSIIGFYTLLRFIYFMIDYHILYQNHNFGIIVKILGLIAIVINSFYAWKSDSLRELIIYSIAAQVGYLCLMLIKPDPVMIGILASYILADSLLKIGLFSSLSFIKNRYKTTITSGNTNILARKLFLLVLFFNLLSSCGLPITIGFINKINVFNIFLSSGEYLSLVVLTFASILAVEYNYKLFKMIYNYDVLINYKSLMPIVLTTSASLLLLIMNEKLINFVSRFFTEVMNG